MEEPTLDETKNPITPEELAKRLRLITLEEAARRIGRTKKTLHNWISLGHLGGSQGLYYVTSRPMIDWALFAAAFIKKAPDGIRSTR